MSNKEFSIEGCIKTSNLILLVIPVVIAVLLLLWSPQQLRKDNTTNIQPFRFILAVLIPSILIVGFLWYFEYIDFSTNSEVCNLKTK